ncbi:Bacteriophage adsorption protein A [Thalassocella blandensis]|nr:Bacteriophage adsorption protein A [Thalassocella blandensis]
MKFCPTSRLIDQFRRLQADSLPPLIKSLLIGTVVTTFSTVMIGCGRTPEKPSEANTAPSPETEQDPTSSKIPDKSFDAETLYSLLVAEMALDRRRYDIALGNYVQQATNTQDPIVAERATQIARGLNARQSALEMSQLWAKLDPSDTDANIVAINELIQANKFVEAYELSYGLHQQGNKNTAFDRIAVAAEHATPEEKHTLLDGYAKLTQANTRHPDVWVGYSILLLQQNQLDQALTAALQAKAIDGNSITSTFQECRVLQKMGKQELANKKLAKLVEDNPKNIGLRARYARLLWSTDPGEAERQFEILHELSPNDPEILYSLALVKKEHKSFNSAENMFQMLITMQQYEDAAHYNLAEIAELQGDTQAALSHYYQVSTGQNYGQAVIRITDILGDENKIDEALSYIQQEKSKQDGPYLETLYLIEADIHSQANQLKLAENALTSGIENFPQSTRLLYARAMLYAQIDYISGAEKDLKYVLSITPNNAAALNALGYTLADRTERFEEAAEYIQRAYELTPNDPAVMDSMGWIAYRMGNLNEALNYLQKAMGAMPDHEIAAHLGEVLWASGDKQNAIEIWRLGLELKPNSDIIHKTLHRLDAAVD